MLLLLEAEQLRGTLIFQVPLLEYSYVEYRSIFTRFSTMLLCHFVLLKQVEEIILNCTTLP